MRWKRKERRFGVRSAGYQAVLSFTKLPFDLVMTIVVETAFNFSLQVTAHLAYWEFDFK
jgi:hypothetical protein